MSVAFSSPDWAMATTWPDLMNRPEREIQLYHDPARPWISPCSSAFIMAEVPG